MSEEQGLRLPISCKVDDLSTEGYVMRRDLDKGERLARAMKIFGVFFFIAFITIFVPILHFILPPLSLIGGCVLAFSEYSNKGEILCGEIVCPNCKKVMALKRDGEDWPRTMRCSGCSFTLTLAPILGPHKS